MQENQTFALRELELGTRLWKQKHFPSFLVVEPSERLQRKIVKSKGKYIDKMKRDDKSWTERENSNNLQNEQTNKWRQKFRQRKTSYHIPQMPQNLIRL